MKKVLFAIIIVFFIYGCGTLTSEEKDKIKAKVVEIIKVSGKAAAEIYLKEKVKDGTLTQEQAQSIGEVVTTIAK